MIILAVFMIVLLVYVMYRLHGGVLLMPSIIMGLFFSVSLSVLSFSIADWGVSISPETLFLIIFSIFSVALGEVFYLILGARSKNTILKDTSEPEEYFVSNKQIFLQVAILAVMAVYVFYQVQGIAGTSGTDIDKTIQGAREALILEDASLGFVGSLLNATAQGFFFAYVYIFSRNVLNTKKIRKNLRYLAPVAVFAVFAFLSTTRTVFAIMIIYAISVYSLLSYQRNKFKLKKPLNKGLIKTLATGMLIFLSIFIWVGSLRGSVQQFDSPFESLRVYIASPIVALDSSLSVNNTERSFGACTLSSFAEKVGGATHGCESGFVQYDLTPTTDQFAYTNVYTGIHPYIKDFGVWGLLGMLTVVGLIYAAVFYRAMNSPLKFRWIVLYAIILYAPAMFTFHDQFSELPFNFTMWISYFVAILILVVIQHNNTKIKGSNKVMIQQ